MTDTTAHRPPERYTPEAVAALLTTAVLGRRIELHPQVASTNDLVREAGIRGEPEGLVVMAEEQMLGRGRLGRRWVAPAGCCVLCSVLLRPRFAAREAFYITIAASLAIYRACKALGGPLQPVAGIKWPNDVLLNGRKVSGVLSEGEFRGGSWDFAVLGFGINANLRPDQLGELRGAATSLSAELGREVDRAALLAKVLTEFEGLYFLLQGGQFGAVHGEWVAALETLGRRVTALEGNGRRVEGKALRADPDGALVVLTGEGVERRVLAGDVLPFTPQNG